MQIIINFVKSLFCKKTAVKAPVKKSTKKPGRPKKTKKAK